MANLLPLASIRLALRDTKTRFAVVFFAACAALGVLAIAALIPSYFLVAGGVHASTTASVATQAQEDEATLLRAQALAGQLAPAGAATRKTAALVTAVVLRPKGIRISSISYSGGAGKSGIIQLVGTADTHQDIETYRDTLQAAGPFSSVNVPVSALVGATRGEFTLTLAGDF